MTLTPEQLASEAAEMLERCALLSCPPHQNGKHRAAEIIERAIQTALDPYQPSADTEARIKAAIYNIRNTLAMKCEWIPLVREAIIDERLAAEAPLREENEKLRKHGLNNGQTIFNQAADLVQLREQVETLRRPLEEIFATKGKDTWEGAVAFRALAAHDALTRKEGDAKCQMHLRRTNNPRRRSCQRL